MIETYCRKIVRSRERAEGLSCDNCAQNYPLATVSRSVSPHRPKHNNTVTYVGMELYVVPLLIKTLKV